MKKIKPIQLNNVISRLKGNSSYELIGNPDVLIESVSGLENAIKNSIIWVSKKKNRICKLGCYSFICFGRAPRVKESFAKYCFDFCVVN